MIVDLCYQQLDLVAEKFKGKQDCEFTIYMTSRDLQDGLDPAGIGTTINVVILVPVFFLSRSKLHSDSNIYYLFYDQRSIKNCNLFLTISIKILHRFCFSSQESKLSNNFSVIVTIRLTQNKHKFDSIVVQSVLY